MRPVLPAGCEAQIGPCGSVGVSESVNLGGYGVELALKNMEYKAMDDSAVKKGWNEYHAFWNADYYIIFYILNVDAILF